MTKPGRNWSSLAKQNFLLQLIRSGHIVDYIENQLFYRILTEYNDTLEYTDDLCELEYQRIMNEPLEDLQPHMLAYCAIKMFILYQNRYLVEKLELLVQNATSLQILILASDALIDTYYKINDQKYGEILNRLKEMIQTNPQDFDVINLSHLVAMSRWGEIKQTCECFINTIKYTFFKSMNHAELWVHVITSNFKESKGSCHWETELIINFIDLLDNNIDQLSPEFLQISLKFLIILYLRVDPKLKDFFFEKNNHRCFPKIMLSNCFAFQIIRSILSFQFNNHFDSKLLKSLSIYHSIHVCLSLRNAVVIKPMEICKCSLKASRVSEFFSKHSIHLQSVAFEDFTAMEIMLFISNLDVPNRNLISDTPYLYFQSCIELFHDTVLLAHTFATFICLTDVHFENDQIISLYRSLIANIMFKEHFCSKNTISHLTASVLEYIAKHHPFLMENLAGILLDEVSEYLNIDIVPRIAKALTSNERYFESYEISGISSKMKKKSQDLKENEVFIKLLQIYSSPDLHNHQCMLHLADDIRKFGSLTKSCTIYCLLIEGLIPLFKKIQHQVFPLVAFVQQICLHLIESETTCWHTVKSLVKFIESMENSANLYRNIVIRSNSLWDASNTSRKFMVILCELVPEYVTKQNLLAKMFTSYFSDNRSFTGFYQFEMPAHLTHSLFYKFMLIKYYPQLLESEHFTKFVKECLTVLKSSHYCRIMQLAPLAEIILLNFDKSNTLMFEDFMNQVLEDFKCYPTFSFSTYLVAIINSDMFRSLNESIKKTIQLKLISLFLHDKLPKHIIAQLSLTMEFDKSLVRVRDHKHCELSPIYDSLKKTKSAFTKTEDFLSYQFLKYKLPRAVPEAIQYPKAVCSRLNLLVDYLTKSLHIFSPAECKKIFEYVDQITFNFSEAVCFKLLTKLFTSNLFEVAQMNRIYNLYLSLWRSRTFSTIVCLTESLLQFCNIHSDKQVNNMYQNMMRSIFMLILDQNTTETQNKYLLSALLSFFSRPTMVLVVDFTNILFQYIDSENFNPIHAWACFRILAASSLNFCNAVEIGQLRKYALKLVPGNPKLKIVIRAWKEMLNLKALVREENFRKTFEYLVKKHSDYDPTTYSALDFIYSNDHFERDILCPINLQELSLQELSVQNGKDPTAWTEFLDHLVQKFNFNLHLKSLCFYLVISDTPNSNSYLSFCYVILMCMLNHTKSVKYQIIVELIRFIESNLTPFNLNVMSTVIGKAIFNKIEIPFEDIYKSLVFEYFLPHVKLPFIEFHELHVSDATYNSIFTDLHLFCPKISYIKNIDVFQTFSTYFGNRISFVELLLQNKPNECLKYLEQNIVNKCEAECMDQLMQNIITLLKCDRDAFIDSPGFSHPTINSLISATKDIFRGEIDRADHMLHEIPDLLITKKSFNFNYNFFENTNQSRNDLKIFLRNIILVQRNYLSLSNFQTMIMYQFMSDKTNNVIGVLFKYSIMNIMFSFEENQYVFLAILDSYLKRNMHLLIKFLIYNMSGLNIDEKIPYDVALKKLQKLTMVYLCYKLKTTEKHTEEFDRILNDTKRFVNEVAEPYLTSVPSESRLLKNIEFKCMSIIFIDYINLIIDYYDYSEIFSKLYNLFIYINQGKKMLHNQYYFWKLNVRLSDKMINMIFEQPSLLLSQFRNSNSDPTEIQDFNQSYLLETFLKKHISSTISFLTNCLVSTKKRSLESLVNILKFFTNYSYYIVPEVVENIKRVPLDRWLVVKPQLMVCLGIESEVVRNIIFDLVIEISDEYPEEMIYSLLATRSANKNMKKKIDDIFEIINERSPIILLSIRRFLDDVNRLVNGIEKQIRLLMEELLKEIKKVLCKNADLRNIKRFLRKMNKILNKEAKTAVEKDFNKKYGNKITRMIQKCLALFKINSFEHRDNDGASFNFDSIQPDIINGFKDELNVFIATMKSFSRSAAAVELSESTLWLQTLEWSALTVPGYNSVNNSSKRVYIKGFRSKVKVIDSKRNPVILTVIGSDDVEYKYILKYNEDLRLDERIMQFLDLVNMFIDTSDVFAKSQYEIVTYPVIPISTHYGLIMIVEDTQPYDKLIKSNRVNSPNVSHEDQYRQGLCQQFSSNDTIHLGNYFREVCRNTPATDLKDQLRHLSQSPYHWNSNRIYFIISSAVMSIVGYVIGLGDRHPQNILICKSTCKVLHIDFGDCFDKASIRSNHPETVPFRLTRMMLEAFGEFDWLFFEACCKILDLLKSKREVIMNLLSSFINDPLYETSEIKVPSTPNQNRIDDQVSAPQHSMQQALDKVRERLFDIMPTEERVDLLIEAATDIDNLKVMWPGWAPAW